VVYLSAHSKTFLEAARTGGHDHEFLDINSIIRMLAAIHDVHHWHRHLLGIGTSQISIQRHMQRACRCPGCCHGHSQHSIGAEMRLILGTIQLQQDGVKGRLFKYIHADHCRSDLGIHMVYRPFHSKAAIPLFPIPEFYCLILPCRRAGRHTGPSQVFVPCQHFHFYSRIPAGI